MSRRYSSWASNQPLINPDLSMMKLTTVMGNEQDQLKNFERVEAIPHMYINVDAPPAPSMTKNDARPIQPAMISRPDSSYFAAPTTVLQAPTKIWPVEKSSRNSSIFENASTTPKRHHKHKHHHHHHHHSDKHRHRHHSQRHRARSAESIRNRQHQRLYSPPKMLIANPQYIEQDQQQQQQQQQQQPMIVYREVPNGEGYTVDPNGLATVPYGADNETSYVDDQQAPMFVYRDANYQPQQQQQQQIITDGLSQQYLFNQDQETIIQQSDPFGQQSSQIVYYTDPGQQDYFSTSNNNNIIQQSISPQQQQQQQFFCLDNTQTAIQPTIINQIPVFNQLSANTNTQSLVNVSQTPLQRATSFIIQQPQPQPLQIVQQQQQQQPLQIVQQPQTLQIMQQPQQLQIIQSPQTQPGQYLQIAQPAPQMIQTVQPQLIQAQPVLQTIQMPTQNVAANPQFLYQRPYDPVLVPIQNQQMAVASPHVLALSQPSYAPSRILPAAAGIQQQQPTGANMFRHALLRTVADRTGLPVPTSSTGGVQLMQPTATAVASNQNLLLAGGIQRSASLPIIPLTPGGILIPFQPSQTPGLRPGPLPRAGGYPSTLRNFNDIRQQMQQRRDQLFESLQQQQQPAYSRIPSPPVLSAAPRKPIIPYTSGNYLSSGPRMSGTPFPSLTPGSYTRLPSPGLSYAQPSFSGSARSASSAPYNPLRS